MSDDAELVRKAQLEEEARQSVRDKAALATENRRAIADQLKVAAKLLQKKAAAMPSLREQQAPHEAEAWFAINVVLPTPLGASGLDDYVTAFVDLLRYVPAELEWAGELATTLRGVNFEEWIAKKDESGDSLWFYKDEKPTARGRTALAAWLALEPKGPQFQSLRPFSSTNLRRTLEARASVLSASVKDYPVRLLAALRDTCDNAFHCSTPYERLLEVSVLVLGALAERLGDSARTKLRMLRNRIAKAGRGDGSAEGYDAFWKKICR